MVPGPGATLGERPASPGPWFSGVIRAARNCYSTRPARRTGWPDERAPATAPPVASWRSWKAACAPAVDLRHHGAIPAPWWLNIVRALLATSTRSCPPTTTPPRRDPTIGGGASPSASAARRVKLSSCIRLRGAGGGQARAPARTSGWRTARVTTPRPGNDPRSSSRCRRPARCRCRSPSLRRAPRTTLRADGAGG